MGRAQSLNKEQVEEIKELLQKGFYKVDIAKKFNISKQTLFNYLHREGISLRRFDDDTRLGGLNALK